MLLTGYGQTGPLRDRAGHDINYLAVSGVASYSGRKCSGPGLSGIQIADVASGSNNAVIGILAAYIYRQSTGKGQNIDISMTDGAISLTAMQAPGYFAGAKMPGCEEMMVAGGSLYDYYETSDGKYVAFGGVEPHFFSAFCTTIGRPDLIPGGIAPKDYKKVKEEIRALMRTRTRDEWTELFRDVDCCFDPVLSLSEALDGDLSLDGV